jgi:thiosulfate/3-mercaptopyruvate sulfurtransferase
MTALGLPGPLVSVEWLAAHLRSAELVVLDAPLGQISHEWIPGARTFDYDRVICDSDSTLPHMMPSAAVFQWQVQKLGINPDSVIVVYDGKGIYSAPRAYWMLKAMGHDAVAVLDGGLPAWKAAGHPVETKQRASNPGSFLARERPAFFAQAEEIAAALRDPKAVVLDVRSAGRFAGTAPEPRPGLRPGHMPGAINLPYTDLLENGRYRPTSALRERLQAKIGNAERLYFSCGSGVTACIVAIAAELSGYRSLTVYDGSWSEWGLPSPRPVVTG